MSKVDSFCENHLPLWYKYALEIAKTLGKRYHFCSKEPVAKRIISLSFEVHVRKASLRIPGQKDVMDLEEAVSMFKLSNRDVFFSSTAVSEMKLCVDCYAVLLRDTGWESYSRDDFEEILGVSPCKKKECEMCKK